MTAVVIVKGPKRIVRVRVFLDHGSQATFVLPALVTALNPMRIDCQQLTVAGFGSTQKAEVKQMARFALTLELDDSGEIKVNTRQQEPFPVSIAAVP